MHELIFKRTTFYNQFWFIYNIKLLGAAYLHMEQQYSQYFSLGKLGLNLEPLQASHQLLVESIQSLLYVFLRSSSLSPKVCRDKNLVRQVLFRSVFHYNLYTAKCPKQLTIFRQFARFSLLLASVRAFEGRFLPSNTRIGLTLQWRSRSINRIAYKTQPFVFSSITSLSAHPKAPLE